MAVKLLTSAAEKASFQSAFIFGFLACGTHRLTDMSSGQLILLSAYFCLPYALLTAVFFPMIVAHSCYPF